MSHSSDTRNGRSRSASRSQSPEERRRKRSRSRSATPNTCKRLHVANIDDTIRRRDIEDAFSKFGKLDDIWLASYPPLYAFVVFKNAEDASAALREMRSGYIRDCHIRTTIALPRNSGRRGPPPRRYRSRSPEHRRRSRSPRRRSRTPERRRRRRSRS